MNDENPYFPGDAKAAPDPAPYPQHWNAEQRVSAYWYALKNHAVPRTTHSWEALLTQAQKHTRRHTKPVADQPHQEPLPIPDEPEPETEDLPAEDQTPDPALAEPPY